MRHRVREQRNEFHHLDKTSWPSVRNDERQRRWSFPAHMHKVDVDSVERDAIPRQLVQCSLFASPVVAMTPVLDQRPHVGEIRTGLPSRALKLIRPACSFETTR